MLTSQTDKIKLPDFLIGGAPKCATTSLSDTLAAHPEVYIPEVKEINFFQDDEYWSRGTGWYSDFFEQTDDAVRICGEATPDYLDSEKAMRRIKDIVPEVKLIFILRNPVERAYSHYWFDLFRGYENRTFHECIHEKYDLHDTIPEPAHQRKDYATHFGFYGKYVSRYYKLFDKKNILIIDFDSLIKESIKVLFSIQNFLNVNKIKLVLPKSNKTVKYRSKKIYQYFHHKIYWNKYSNFAVRNIITDGGYDKLLGKIDSLNTLKFKKPAMDKRDREYLVSLYRDDIRLLSEITGQNFNSWLKK